MKIYLQLFLHFFQTGLFAVGGGLATLPFLSDMGKSTGWFNDAQLADMVAVAESTPGPIGINTATYVGYTSGGILGGIIATLGLITPSIIIILIIAQAIEKYNSSRIVKTLFYFLKPASVALICSSLIKLFANTIFLDYGTESCRIYPLALLFALVLLTLTNIPKLKALHPIVWIALSAVVGILFL